MKNIYKMLTVCLFFTLKIFAQFTITANFNGNRVPPNALFYHLENASEKYIGAGEKQQGDTFLCTFSKNAPVGMYRMVYQSSPRLFVDFIFNKEDISFTFNSDLMDDVQFSKSRENKLYNAFLEEYYNKEQLVTAIQRNFFEVQDPLQNGNYTDALSKLDTVYQKYFNASKGMWVQAIIKASKLYHPANLIAKPVDYIKEIQAHFLDGLNFNDKHLLASDFLKERAIEFVFELHQGKYAGLDDKLKQKAAKKIFERSMPLKFKKNLLQNMIVIGIEEEITGLTQLLFNDYYKKLPVTFQEVDFKNYYRKNMRLAIGNTAPELTWLAGEKTLKLTTLTGGTQYLLTFWSSGCSHCQKVIPAVYRFVKKYPKLQVVAVGLEHEDSFEKWKGYAKKMPRWHHLFINQDNEKNNAMISPYNITSTPTFLLLDKNKKIITRPGSFKKVRKFIKK